jgi:hypothetical protein
VTGSTRQAELFAGQDWTVLYRAFTQTNFNASDPPSINRALREYVRINYPEDYNDWIESSEFVAIIDLLSWLAGTLAYKTDLAARENFLETAEARESILRLARFLSYNPRRHQPARGILKLIRVVTDDDVQDAFGNSISNVGIEWNNPNDPDWYDRFIAVLNAALVAPNPFGVPLKQGVIGGTRAQLYRFNNRVSDMMRSFGATASGENMVFEFVNGDFDTDGAIFERTPTPGAAFHIFNLSDGGGYASPRTGFFAFFKQGTTGSETFQITNPIENQLLELAASGVNQDDVWVQTVDDAGEVLVEWSKVPALYSENITYTGAQITDRNIFSVVTREADRIAIRFSDGLFGNAPIGRIKIIFRTGNGLQYEVRPQEVDRVNLLLPYYNRRGVKRTLTMTFSLFEKITNATPRETNDQIRRRAPLVYGAQNRMVSGEDYNVFPLQANVAVKIKAVNRVYSGQSRHVRLNDPTGTYQDVNLFADDGILFEQPDEVFEDVPLGLNRTAAQVLELHIRPLLRREEVREAMRAAMMVESRAGNIAVPDGTIWRYATSTTTTATGWFTKDSTVIRPGALIQFRGSYAPEWVAVLGMTGPANIPPAAGGFPGPVTLAAPVPDGATVTGLLPRYLAEVTGTIAAAIEDRISNRASFTLWYNYATPDNHWVIDVPMRRPGPPVFRDTAIPVMTVNYIAGIWRLEARGVKRIFESLDTVQWYNEGRSTINSTTGASATDVVRVLRTNEDRRNQLGRGLSRDFEFGIGKLWHYPNGTPEPRRVNVYSMDKDEDGYPDDPDAFWLLLPGSEAESTLFWSRSQDGLETPINTIRAYETEAQRLDDSVPDGVVAFQISSPGSSMQSTFWQKTGGAWVQLAGRSYRVARGRGPNMASIWITASGERILPRGDRLSFQWRHRAASDHRIDPATSNIHDIFVLTSDYDYVVRQWIAQGSTGVFPTPPTELDLRIAFREFEQFKMFSDQIVWRPVRYKPLFGEGAIPSLRAQFKAVKLTSTIISDGEVRSRVILAVNDFFSISRWDFGETFYFTELAAYIHQQLAGIIGSIVIVPQGADASFGDGFEVRCRPDELPLSTARVADVVIISANTPTNLRIR